MWIPDALYERLPQLYGATGVACLLWGGASGPALLSAAALVAAAALVHQRRRSYRSRPAGSRRRPGTSRRHSFGR